MHLTYTLQITLWLFFYYRSFIQVHILVWPLTYYRYIFVIYCIWVRIACDINLENKLLIVQSFECAIGREKEQSWSSHHSVYNPIWSSKYTYSNVLLSGPVIILYLFGLIKFAFRMFIVLLRRIDAHTTQKMLMLKQNERRWSIIMYNMHNFHLLHKLVHHAHILIIQSAVLLVCV